MPYRIPERVVPGRRLGRHVHHDPRSLRYLVAPRAHAARTVRWERVTPVLDQGNVGSCTGNATVGVLGTTPFYATIPAGITLDESAALAVYGLATRLDSIRGQYPPDDTGSDGLSAAKAAVHLGLISGYQHCTSVDAVITALQDGPVIAGVNWYDTFDQPDRAGRVALPADATLRGGHEFELVGVDLEAKLIEAVNSWGPDWAVGGHFYLPLAVFERLLREDGDVTVFTPVTAAPPVPKPTPGPVPDPSPLTVQYTDAQYAALGKWAAGKTYAGTAAARRAWKAATG